MLRDQLNALLEPVVQSLGYELWELEFAARQGGGLLRLYIDRPVSTDSAAAADEEGITLDDCARVSHAVSEVLDAEDPVPGHYTLEVSSPGLDRVLRTPAHFARYVNHRVRVEMTLPVNGRKRFVGRLLEVGEQNIVLDLDEGAGQVSLSIEGLHKARLVPDL